MTQKLAKFGCYVTRWKDGKVYESWTEHVAFRADPALEHTDAVWDTAKGAAGKKWKQTAKSGWEVTELWMESPSHW
jgi:hypothetical protein